MAETSEAEPIVPQPSITHQPAASNARFRRILVVPFDHLNRNAGVLRDANPESDLIAMVESQRMLTGRPWHT